MLRTIDGQAVYLSVTGGPLYDTQGQLIGAVAIARDVSEGHRLEQLERRIHAETEARLTLLQMVLDELPSSVYLVRGRDARLVLANRTATTIWGATWAHNQSMSEFLKENDIRIVGMDGKVLAPEQFATLRALRSGESVYQHQESIRHPDGTTLPVLVNAVTLDASHLFSSSACCGVMRPKMVTSCATSANCASSNVSSSAPEIVVISDASPTCFARAATVCG
jgi:PAS domain-containing protein